MGSTGARFQRLFVGRESIFDIYELSPNESLEQLITFALGSTPFADLSNISVERLIQIPDHKRKRASIVIITHKSKEIDAQNCLKSFRSNKNIIKSPVLIRLFK